MSRLLERFLRGIEAALDEYPRTCFAMILAAGLVLLVMAMR